MKTALSEWFKLTDTNKRNIFAETARQKALPVSSIEKDWWVVQTLSALFSSEYADKLIFKGLCTSTHNLFFMYTKTHIFKIIKLLYL